MKNMSVPFYLYRQHDMDLINIYRRDGYKFQKEVKKALVEFANGRIYQISVPDLPIRSGYIAKSIPMHLTLNPQSADELVAINLLKNTRKGFRCQLIKAIYRISLTTLPLGSFSKDGNGDGFTFKRPDIDDAIQNGFIQKKVQDNSPPPEKSKSISINVPEQVPVPKPKPKKETSKPTINTSSEDAEVSKAPIVEEYQTPTADQNELAEIFGQMDSLTH